MIRAVMYRGWTSLASVIVAGLLLVTMVGSSDSQKEDSTAIAIASEQDVNETEEDAVVILTPKDFKQTLKKHDRVLVDFYAHWHAGCKRLAPEYEEAARTLKKKGMKTLLAKIDAEADWQFAIDECGFEYKETEWPVLRYYKNGNQKTDYKGEKNAAAIASWLAKKEAPLIQEIMEEDADRFVQQTTVGEFAVIARVKPKSPREKAYWKMVEDFLAEEKYDNIRFAEIPLPKEADPKKDATLTMWRTGFEDLDAEQISFSSTWNAQEMSRWVLGGTYPLVGSDFSSHGKYGILAREELGIDASVIALLPGGGKDAEDGAEDGGEEMKFQMLEVLAPLAEEHPKWRFTTVRIGALADEDFAALGVTNDTEPLLCVLQGKRRYVLEGKETMLQADAVKDFLDKVKAKKARAAYKSAAAPKKLIDKDGITTLTGRTFEDYVLDPSKDVFVKFYVPGDVICKQLSPEWKRLAERVKKESWQDRVVIAQIDGTENETPEDVSSYPVIMFYPAVKADKKYKNKKRYKGVHSYDKMLKFLVDNAKNLEDVEDAGEKKGKRKAQSYAEREYQKRKKAMEL